MQIVVAPLELAYNSAMTTSLFICPLDRTPLQQQESSWHCAHGHSFDMARQGYVNLLPVQHKRSRDPGDSKAMVQARAEFLAAGYYAPIAAALSDVVLRSEPVKVLDAGCGEGYYLRALGDHTLAKNVQRVGLDISKWAVAAAARTDKSGAYVVASNSAIPLADDSVDAVLSVFGFAVLSEFKRVLRPGGRLITVDPAPQHLAELKAIIYAEVHEKAYDSVVTDDWSLCSEQRVTFEFELPTAAAIQQLLTMTPHLYRASAEGRARAEALTSLRLTADVYVREFEVGK